ncbi:hypothetical protein ACK9YZ_05630 [Rhizobium sp. ZK1]|uniref:hypothetical protein n=1 Tax=Rhizobium sp. ZK1 TaxID=3389872 RepID=UPI0039F691A5
MQHIPDIVWSAPIRDKERIRWNGSLGEYGAFEILFWFASDKVEARYLGRYRPLQDITFGGRQLLERHYDASLWKGDHENTVQFAFRYGSQTAERGKVRAAQNGAFKIGLLKAIELQMRKYASRLFR